MQLQAGPPLDEMSISCILRDLLHAIEYLHSEGKIHRDIKGSLSYSDVSCECPQLFGTIIQTSSIFLMRM